MTHEHPQNPGDRITELARRGAQAAADVLAQLCGTAAAAGGVRPCAGPVPDTHEKLETGVLFEFDGGLSGGVALLLSRPAREQLLQALGVEEEHADSALREVGNMLASHAVSAVADALEGRVTLSVPTLVREDAASVVQRWLARRAEMAVTSTPLDGDAGAGEFVLVFAVEAA